MPAVQMVPHIVQTDLTVARIVELETKAVSDLESRDSRIEELQRVGLYAVYRFTSRRICHFIHCFDFAVE